MLSYVFSSFCVALSLQEENTRIFQSEIESRIVTVLRASLPGFFCTMLGQEIQENVTDGNPPFHKFRWEAKRASIFFPPNRDADEILEVANFRKRNR